MWQTGLLKNLIWLKCYCVYESRWSWFKRMRLVMWERLNMVWDIHEFRLNSEWDIDSLKKWSELLLERWHQKQGDERSPVDLSPWSYKLYNYNSTKNSQCSTQTHLRDLHIETSESRQIWWTGKEGREKKREWCHGHSPEHTVALSILALVIRIKNS